MYNIIVEQSLALRIARFLQEHPECTKILQKVSNLDNLLFVERFILEVERGATAKNAEKTAIKAANVKKDGKNPIVAIKDAVDRFPRSLDPGEHVKYGDLTLVNLSKTHQIFYASKELTKAISRPTTCVFESGVDFQARQAHDKEIITLDPGHKDASQKLRVYLGADPDKRYRELFMRGRKPDNEHLIQFKEIRELVIDYFTASVFYAEDGTTVLKLDEEVAISIVDALKGYLDIVTQTPRVVIPVRWQTLLDLEATTPWEQDPIRLRATVNAITRDNKELNNLVRDYPHARAGYLSFVTGDRLIEGLLSPRLHASVFLKEECLQDTVFFPNAFMPETTLNLPDVDFGFYCAAASSENVIDLFKLKCLLQFTMATDKSINEYLQGISSNLHPREDTPHPLSGLLSILSPSLMKGRKLSKKELASASLLAITLASYRALSNPDGLGAIGCLYYGKLDLDKVERVEVEVQTSQEFIAFHRQKQLSDQLTDASRFYEKQGIEFIIKPPVESDMAHTLGITSLLSEVDNGEDG